MWDGKEICDLAIQKKENMQLQACPNPIFKQSLAYQLVTILRLKISFGACNKQWGITSLADLHGDHIGSANIEITTTALLQCLLKSVMNWFERFIDI